MPDDPEGALESADFIAHMNDARVHRNTVARMFRHPLPEACSKVHPAVPMVVFAPVVGVALWRSLATADAIDSLLGVVAGALIWTLAEYLLHRFLFHFPDGTPAGRFVYFYTHGIHHHYPDDATRLVMTPVISVPFALAFYGLFHVLFPSTWLGSIFAGFVSGYLVYDYVHYATHFVRPPVHPAFRWLAAVMKEQRRRHMSHHFKDCGRGFGVSTAWWDFVFRTRI